MRKPLSCQFARRRQEAVEGAAELPAFAVSPPHSDAFALRRIRGHSPDCLGKGETENDRSRRLWAIPRRSSDIVLRPAAAVLVKDDSRGRALAEPLLELWRHSRCATIHRIEPHGRAGNLRPPRLLC